MRIHPTLVVIALLGGLVASDAGAFPESTNPAMKDPSAAKEAAPETFRAKFETSKGDIVFECTRDWAPNGVDRFYNLVKIGFFQDVAFFRVLKTFVVQFGIHGNPEVSAKWRDANLPADPVKQSNTRGTLTYAMSGNSNLTRTTQLFINYKDNANLDKMKFSPICKVVEGMDVADKLNDKYGGAPSDQQMEIQSQGNAFLRETFPDLDYIKSTSIVSEGKAATPPAASPGDKPSNAAPGEQKSNNTLYYVLGAFGLAAAAAFFFYRSREEPPPPPPKKVSVKTARKPATSAPSTGNKRMKKKKKRRVEG